MQFNIILYGFTFYVFFVTGTFETKDKSIYPSMKWLLYVNKYINLDDAFPVYCPSRTYVC